MPNYNLKREGYNVTVKNFRLVNAGVCEKVNHDIRFNTSGLNHVQLAARNKVILDFMDAMNGREYAPDGPTLYCMECQENCRYKGMEG